MSYLALIKLTGGREHRSQRFLFANQADGYLDSYLKANPEAKKGKVRPSDKEPNVKSSQKEGG